MNARVLVNAVVALVLAGSANAAILLQDDFESYADQAAFEAAWTPTSPPTSMSLFQAFGYSGTQAVNGVCSVSLTTRNYRNFASTEASDATPMTWEFWMMLGDPANAGARNFNEIRSYEGGAYDGQDGLVQLLAMGAYNIPFPATQWSVRTLYGSYGTGWVATSVARSAGWHKLTAIVTSAKVEYYVDDVLAHTAGAYTIGRPFDSVVLGSSLLSNGMDAWTDDMLVEVVPEPATLALLGLGGLFLHRRRQEDV